MLAHRTAQGKTPRTEARSAESPPQRDASLRWIDGRRSKLRAGACGDRIAADYADLHTHLDPRDAVEALARLAGGGRVLELGIDTGRLALPLAARGIEMHGIDAPEAMVAKLRAKPGGDAATLDRAQQRITARLVSIAGEGATQYPIEVRYVRPSGLDLMARLAGLRLRGRWSGWQGEPFTAASRSHVSICERA